MQFIICYYMVLYAFYASKCTENCCNTTKMFVQFPMFDCIFKVFLSGGARNCHKSPIKSSSVGNCRVVGSQVPRRRSGAGSLWRILQIDICAVAQFVQIARVVIMEAAFVATLLQFWRTANFIFMQEDMYASLQQWSNQM